jgi:hypothetical protein
MYCYNASSALLHKLSKETPNTTTLFSFPYHDSPLKDGGSQAYDRSSVSAAVVA